MNSDQLEIKEYLSDFEVNIYIQNLEECLNTQKRSHGAFPLVTESFRSFKDDEEISLLVNLDHDSKECSKPILDMKGLIGNELKRLYVHFGCKLTEKIFLKSLSVMTDDRRGDTKKVFIVLFKIVDRSISIKMEH